MLLQWQARPHMFRLDCRELRYVLSLTSWLLVLAHDIYSIYEQDDDPFYNRFMTSCFIITTILPRQWKKTLAPKLGSSIILLEWKWDSKTVGKAGGPGSPSSHRRGLLQHWPFSPELSSAQIWCWWYLKHHTGASQTTLLLRLSTWDVTPA